MNRDVKLVLSALFLLVFGAFLSGTILIPYAESLGASWAVVSVLPGSMYVVRLVFGTPIGKFADKKGALKVLRYSLILYPLIAVAYYYATNIPMLFIARLLHGLASAMMLPMVGAYIGQRSPTGKEGRYMGMYNLILFLGSGLGSLLSTVIASKISYRANFVFLFILAVVSLLIALSVKEDTNHKEPENTVIEAKQQVPNKSLLKNSGLTALAILKLPLAVISYMVGFFFVQYPSSLIAAGLILAVYNILSGASQIPFGRLSDKADKFGIIIFSAVLTAAALAVLPLTHSNVVMLVLMIVVGIGTAAMVSSSAALSAIVGRQLGMAGTMGFLETVSSLGMIIGGISFAFLPDRLGISAVFTFCCLTTVIGTAAFAILWTKHRKAVQPR